MEMCVCVCLRASVIAIVISAWMVKWKGAESFMKMHFISCTFFISISLFIRSLSFSYSISSIRCAPSYWIYYMHSFINSNRSTCTKIFSQSHSFSRSPGPFTKLIISIRLEGSHNQRTQHKLLYQWHFYSPHRTGSVIHDKIPYI